MLKSFPRLEISEVLRDMAEHVERESVPRRVYTNMNRHCLPSWSESIAKYEATNVHQGMLWRSNKDNGNLMS